MKRYVSHIDNLKLKTKCRYHEFFSFLHWNITMTPNMCKSRDMRIFKQVGTGRDIELLVEIMATEKRQICANPL